jgi:phosphoethanolamine N-methyltransferase
MKMIIAAFLITSMIYTLHGKEEFMDYQSLDEVYTPKYCLQLEAAYGKGMMSEGGQEAVEHMFQSIPLKGKTALDIGSGLGGVPFYLAEKYDMHVTGLEVNPWMYEESIRRIPNHLKDKTNFLLSCSNSNWDIPKQSLDLIYSKGVLTHVETKNEIFQEFHRILKEDGLLVISDCISQENKQWGKNIARLVDLEHLPMFPESESGYIEALKKSGFTIHSVRDDSLISKRFNDEIVERLQDPILREVHLTHFTETELEDAIDGYKAIASALKSGEMRIVRFIASKKERIMEHVEFKNATVHANSPNCTVYEYPMKNSELNIGVAEVKGRYPNQGYAINHKCSEMGYILKGFGKLVTETAEAILSPGDAVYIPRKEKYYFEGNITVVIPSTPAWHPEQHETGD